MPNNTNSQFTGQTVNTNPGNLRTSGQAQGTGFTNLNKYLQANQNNQLGNTVVNGINKDVNQVNQGLQQSQNDFNGQIQQNTDQLDQYGQQSTDTLNKLNQNYGNLNSQYQANPSNTDYSAQNYQKYDLLDPTDYSNFDAMRGYQYKGPTQLGNYDKLQQQSQQTEQLGNLTNTNAGRAALLSRYVNNPQYNSFQQNLDSLYLQGSQPQLQQARRQTQGLYNQTTQAGENASNQAALANQAVSNFQTGLQGKLSDQEKTRLDALTGSANQYATDQQNALNNLNSGHLSDQDVALTGLNHGTRIFNLGSTLGNYATPEFTPTQQNAANIADRADLAALAKLSGSQLPPMDLSAQQYDPTHPYSFRTNDFMTAVNAANKDYENAYNSATNPFLYNGKNGIDAQQYKPGSPLAPMQYGFTDPTAAKELQTLLANANPQGIISQGGFTYDVNNALQGLQSILSGIQDSKGYNNKI